MSDEIKFEISIPTDEDGFILLQCPLCGDLFKISVPDYNADDIYELWCPACGLKSENYLTEEVLDLALKMAKNRAQDMLHNQLKQMERKTRGRFISFKVSRKHAPEYENPLVPIIDELELMQYLCCQRHVKISPILKLTGSFCPFCGVNYDEY